MIGIEHIIIIAAIVFFIAYYFFSPKRRLMAQIKVNSKNRQWQDMLVNIYRWLKLKDSRKQTYSLKVLMREDKNKGLCREILALQHAIVHETNFNAEKLFKELRRF